MTTAAARLRASAESAAERSRPGLRLVPRSPRIAGRLPFGVLVGSILVGGLVALLLLHTMAAQDAFRLHDLQRQAAELADTQQQLASDTQKLESPATLATRARALGMVPTDSISFIRLRNGRLVGVAHAAPAAPAPAPAPRATSTATSTATSKPATAGTGTGASSGRTRPDPAGCPHAHCRATNPR